MVTPIVPKAPTLERPIGVTVTSVRSSVDGVAISAEIDADDMIRASEFVAFSVYGDSSRWEYFRKTHSRSRGLVSGLIFVVGKSVASVPQSLLGFLREPARRKQRLQFDTRMPATTYATPQQSDPRQRLNTENTVKDGEEKYLEVEG